ncbi:MAG: M56 family metallopeptidase [Gemmatimonadota bacterium]
MPAILTAVSATVLTYASHSAAACVVTLLLGRLLRRPQERDLLWKAAFVAPLLTTSVALRGGVGAFERLNIDLSDVARRASMIHLPGRRLMVRVLDDGAGERIIKQLDDPVALALAVAVISVALVAIALASARLVGRRRALARALVGRRAFPGVADPSINLSIASDLPSPVALGASEICLPSVVAREFSTRHRDTLIAHEVAHLQRKDPHWFAFVEVVTAVSAFQPLIFLVAREFRRDVELICDEAAVRRTHDRQGLIGALALLASPFDARSSLRGAATAYDGSPLVARATRIAGLDERDTATRRNAFVAIGALAAGLSLLPVVSPAPALDAAPADIMRNATNRAHEVGRLVDIDSTVTVHTKQVRVMIR